jgi:hypothetical protein
MNLVEDVFSIGIDMIVAYFSSLETFSDFGRRSKLELLVRYTSLAHEYGPS